MFCYNLKKNKDYKLSLVLDIFKEITAIQRCSSNHSDFINFMKKENVYEHESRQTRNEVPS
mgnify:CR=1 FL=1